MNFHNILGEALKSEHDPLQSTLHKFKVPQLEIPMWKKNWMGKTKKFEKVPDEFVSQNPAEGYFFSYNPVKNAAFESNASFAFIIGRYPQKNIGNSRWQQAAHYHDLIDKRHTHPDFSNYEEINFLVDKSGKRVLLEKKSNAGSSGNNIINGRIEKPDEVQDALTALVHHHSEAANYKFVPAKQKVSDYLTGGVASLSSGGNILAYFEAIGDEMKVILKEGLDSESISKKTTGYNHNITIHFDKKEAVKEAKYHSGSNRLYHIWAVAEFTISDIELLDKKHGSYKIAEGKKVPPGDIKVIKTNYPAFFKDDWAPAKNFKDEIDSKLIKHLRKWDNIIIAKDEDEYKNFKLQQLINTRKRAPSTFFSYFGENTPIGLELKNGTSLLMFKPGSTKKDIDKFFAGQWFKSLNLDDIINKEHRNNFKNVSHDDKRDIAYDVFFNKKVPDYMQKILIKDSFEKIDGHWRRYTKEFLNSLGLEVKDEA